MSSEWIIHVTQCTVEHWLLHEGNFLVRTEIPEINAWLKECESVKFKGFNKNAILLIRKQGIPVYGHYKMFKNRNYNNASQKRLAKFALIKYLINFWN